MELNRRQMSIVVQLCTGHVPLMKYLFHIRKVDSPTCPSCQQGEESMHHFIFDFPTWRYECWFMGRTLGRFVKLAHQVLGTQKGIKELLNFVGHTGRLKRTFGGSLWLCSLKWLVGVFAHRYKVQMVFHPQPATLSYLSCPHSMGPCRLHEASTLPAHWPTPRGGLRFTSSSYQAIPSCYPLLCQTTLWGGQALNSLNSRYRAKLRKCQPSGYCHWGSTCKRPQGGQAAVDEGLSAVPWVSQRSRGQGRGPGVHLFLHNSSFLPMKYVKSLFGSALLDSKIKKNKKKKKSKKINKSKFMTESLPVAVS